MDLNNRKMTNHPISPDAPPDRVQSLYSVTTAECRSYLLITRGVYNIPNIRIRGSSCTDIRIRGSPSFDICMCIRFRGSSCTDIRRCIRGSRNFGIRYISSTHQLAALQRQIGAILPQFPSPQRYCSFIQFSRRRHPYYIYIIHIQYLLNKDDQKRVKK